MGRKKKSFDVEGAVSKAMHLFWRNGYRGTSVEELVEHTGMSRARLYETFGDKHTLFLSALSHYERVQEQERSAEPSGSTSPRQAILDRFEAAIAETIDKDSRDGCLMVNTALELSPHDPVVAEIVARAFARMEAFFGTCIERAQAIGEIPPSAQPRQVAAALMALLIGVRVLERSGSEPPSLRSIADQAATLVATSG